MRYDLSEFDSMINRKKKNMGFPEDPLFVLPNIVERSRRIERRHIEGVPFRILDAPGVMDDYYLNILDWNGDKITIGLKNMVYSYDISTKDVTELYSSDSAYISCVKGTEDRMLIGNSNGEVLVYDYNKEKIIEKKKVFETRIGVVDVHENVIALGSKEGKILLVEKNGLEEVRILQGHAQEVCGLRWKNGYLASGGNDNLVKIWRMESSIGRKMEGHNSAVKALAWCPWKTNLLISGGGSLDQTVKFWNTEDGKCMRTVNVESQVSSITYIKRYKEIMTSHGYRENDIRIWKSNGMKLMTSFGSHEGRVLNTAISPDECTVASLGSDESLKFWKIAEKQIEPKKRDSIGLR